MTSRSEFVIQQKKSGVSVKSAVMEFAAQEKGLEIDRIDSSLILVNTSKGAPLVFRNMYGSYASAPGRFLCDRKHYVRQILGQAGLSVVPSRIFRRGQRGSAWKYALSLGLPVVLKPPSMSRGRGVTTSITTEQEFRAAWRKVISAVHNPERARFIVEKHIYGEDIRFFVVGDTVVSATHKKRAFVTGDGQSTIEQLIERKNVARRVNTYLGRYLIPTDQHALDHMTDMGHTLESIPNDGDEITLRSTSTLAHGGDSIDITDQVHESLNVEAIKAVKSIPGIQYAGVDIIATSTMKEATPNTHVVSEIEFSPGPSACFPIEGPPRDMAGAILDFYLQHESDD